MRSPKLLIATVSAVSLIGAATFAFAQTPSTPSSQSQVQTGNQGTMQRDGQMSNPSSTMTPNSGTPTQRSQDSTATGTGNTGNMGTSSTDRMQRDGSTGATGTNSSNSGNTTMQNDNSRSAADGTTMRSERMARADRN